MESELVFPKPWGADRGSFSLQGTVLFEEEKVLGLCVQQYKYSLYYRSVDFSG